MSEVDLEISGPARSPGEAETHRAAKECSGTELAPYPLTPLQHGMLFQTLLAPTSGVDIEQLVCRFHEPLDVVRLERAWSRAVQRHDVLRTRFRWADLPSPVQEVVPEVRLDFALCYHADLAPPEQEARLERHLAEDRARGFDLTEAPAMRLAYFRRAADEHVLVWSFHHILLDARSISQVLVEVLALYDADVEGGEADLSARRPFRDHVAWLQGRDPAADEAYWAGRLQGLGGTVPVRTVRHSRRDPEAEPHFGEREVQLSPTATAALLDFRREHGVFLNTLAQGAWALLLGYYTGSDEVLFGAARSGRATGVEGAEGMVGLLLNTVPVRVSLPAEARVIDWLREIASRNAALRPHEHSALPDIARWSGLPPGTALSDTIFDYQPQAFDAPFRNLGGRWEGRSFRLIQHAGYPLTAGVFGEAPLRLQIGYDADLFDTAAVDRMLGHFARLLEEIVADPDRRLGALDPLEQAERRLVVEEWNRTAAEYPADRCIHQLFEAQVVSSPDAVAVVSGRESLSYHALNERANRLAHHLRRLGVGAEVRVGICLERSLEMAVSVLGVLKAGGAYVPLDPAYPVERLEFMIADSAAEVLLTQERLRDALAVQPGVKVVSVDAAWPEIAVGSAENPATRTTPRNLAYTIYTSGSTGAPKGVAVEHRSVVNFTVATVACLGVRPSDRVLQLASPAFDIMVEELFPAWSCGASVILAAHGLLAPGELLAGVERLGITWMDLPTAYWHEWALHLARTGDRLPASLRFVVVGGEQISRERLTGWVGTGVPLVHMYGVTEATVNSTAFRLHAGEDGARWPALAIGRPTGNARTYVLDPAMRPVPAGVPGELWIGGVGLARGYLGRPELTAQRFAPDPFAPEPGARLYRTGDRARWLVSGDLEFLGRIDRQVKIRGFRIEPGEIEAVLREHAAVRDCVVVALADPAGEMRLVAYVVGRGEAAALREHLRRSLPEHMVPGVFVTLHALPLTPGGKLDREALPEPHVAGSAEETYREPRTPTEVLLAGIWAEVLSVGRVGAVDDFFDLGGHSLRATQVVGRVEAAFGVALPVRVLFESPTVELLARVVDASCSQGGAEHRRMEELLASIEGRSRSSREGGPATAFE